MKIGAAIRIVAAALAILLFGLAANLVSEGWNSPVSAEWFRQAAEFAVLGLALLAVAVLPALLR